MRCAEPKNSSPVVSCSLHMYHYSCLRKGFDVFLNTDPCEQCKKSYYGSTEEKCLICNKRLPDQACLLFRKFCKVCCSEFLSKHHLYYCYLCSVFYQCCSNCDDVFFKSPLEGLQKCQLHNLCSSCLSGNTKPQGIIDCEECIKIFHVNEVIPIIDSTANEGFQAKTLHTPKRSEFSESLIATPAMKTQNQDIKDESSELPHADTSNSEYPMMEEQFEKLSIANLSSIKATIESPIRKTEDIPNLSDVYDDHSSPSPQKIPCRDYLRKSSLQESLLRVSTRLAAPCVKCRQESNLAFLCNHNLCFNCIEKMMEREASCFIKTIMENRLEDLKRKFKIRCLAPGCMELISFPVRLMIPAQIQETEKYVLEEFTPYFEGAPCKFYICNCKMLVAASGNAKMNCYCPEYRRFR